jgi:hypothetical protein
MAKAEKGKILKETINLRKLEELFPFPYKKNEMPSVKRS